MPAFFSSRAYPLLLLAGIGVSVAVWRRLAKRDERLLLIYLSALVSAFAGAKLVYLAAEGWLYWNAPDRWLIWATGKSILGALLFGYAGVELAKAQLGYRSATGDFFAVVVPVGVTIGRFGCLLNGCCLGEECEPHWWTLADTHGRARWPAVPAEIVFNLVLLAHILWWRKRQMLRGQLFHLYLMGYGLFRFVHELFRATPHFRFGWSGYQVAALAVFALGLWGFRRRARSQDPAVF